MWHCGTAVDCCNGVPLGLFVLYKLETFQRGVSLGFSVPLFARVRTRAALELSPGPLFAPCVAGAVWTKVQHHATTKAMTALAIAY